MKYKCPKCDVSFRSDYSRYSIWDCDSCGARFRGLHCDADMFDYYLHNVPVLPHFFLADATYKFDLYGGGPNYTHCPHCFSDINGSNGKSRDGNWPSVCHSCTNSLPTSKHVEKKPVAEAEVVKPKKKKSEYEKLRELIDRL